MAEKSVARAARLGYHLGGSGGVDLQQMYDAGLQQYGRNTDDYHIAQLRAVYVAESRERAWDDVEPHLHYMMSSYDRRFKEADDLPWSDSVMSTPTVPPVGELRHVKDLSFFPSAAHCPALQMMPFRRSSAIARKRASPIW